MRTPNIVLLLLCAIINLSAYAQNKLTGKVVDENNEEITAAAVIVTIQNNNKAINTYITDIQGRFSFDLPSDNYTVRVNFLGYKEYVCDISVSSNCTLPDIQLQQDVTETDEVVITARKARTLTCQVNGKLHVNVADTYLNDIGNALDVLKHSPGIMIDSTGKISLTSLGGISLYVNNKKNHAARPRT
jgi:hypothetical protein